MFFSPSRVNEFHELHSHFYCRRLKSLSVEIFSHYRFRCATSRNVRDDGRRDVEKQESGMESEHV